MKKHSDIFIFGDSFMAGDELASTQIPNFTDIIQQKFPKETIKVDRTGTLLLDKLKDRGSVWNFIKSYVDDYYDGKTTEVDKSLTFGNKFAEKINMPVYNLATAGASYVRIMESIVSNHDLIKSSPSPLILVGTTGPDRKSHFEKYNLSTCPSTNVHTTILSFDNPFYTGQTKLDYQAYQYGEMIFGDDQISKAHHVHMFIAAVKHLLKDFDVMIYNTRGDILDDETFYSWYCSHIFYEDLSNDDQRLEQATRIRNMMLSEIEPHSVGLIQHKLSTDEKVSCLLGHPLPFIHTIVSEDLYIDYVKKYSE